MLDFFVAAYQENPAATLEVFVHKAESLAEDYKIGTWSYDTAHVHYGTMIATGGTRVNMGYVDLLTCDSRDLCPS
jgi:hypothetical protein